MNFAHADHRAQAEGDSLPPMPIRAERYNQAMEKVVARYPLKAQPKDTDYWRTRPLAERLDAVELLRREWMRDHPDAVEGLQRICRVVTRSRG